MVCGSIPNSSQSTLVQDTHLWVAFDHLILIMPSQCVCMLNVSKDAYMIHKKMYMWVSESSMCLKVVWKYRFKAAPHTFDYVEWFFTLIFSLVHFSLKLGRFSSCQHLCSDSFNWKPKHNNAHQFTLVTRLARQRELMLPFPIEKCWSGRSKSQ